jgi:hypothetical protein
LPPGGGSDVPATVTRGRLRTGARVKAAKKLLYWGHGPPPNYHSELPLQPWEIPVYPTNEEIAAEMYRRGMLPVLDLIDEELLDYLD